MHLLKYSVTYKKQGNMFDSETTVEYILIRNSPSLKQAKEKLERYIRDKYRYYSINYIKDNTLLIKH